MATKFTTIKLTKTEQMCALKVLTHALSQQTLFNSKNKRTLISIVEKLKPEPKKAAEPIVIKCYNNYDLCKDRQKALKFYREAAWCCDGCEKERYTNIYMLLEEGYNYVTDDGEYAKAVPANILALAKPCKKY